MIFVYLLLVFLGMRVFANSPLFVVFQGLWIQWAVSVVMGGVGSFGSYRYPLSLLLPTSRTCSNFRLLFLVTVFGFVLGCLVGGGPLWRGGRSGSLFYGWSGGFVIPIVYNVIYG